MIVTVTNSLQATALVNEAWMRLCEERRQDWQDERQLIAAASEVNCEFAS